MLSKFKLFGKDAVLNKEIKKFFFKLLAFIIAWQLLYNFVLKPIDIPDHFLTETTAKVTVASINTFLHVDPIVTVAEPVQPDYAALVQNNKVVMVIANICNALDLMVIYLSIIWLLPFYTFKRKISFSLGGIVVIYLANIVRCTLLYWLYFFHRPLFALNHKYIFTLLLYLLIFYGWVLFTKKGIKHEKS